MLFNIVQARFGPNQGMGLEFCQRRLRAIGGAQEGIEKETVHIGFCRVFTRQSYIIIVDIDSIRPNLGLIWPTLVEYENKSRSFGGQNGPNLGTSGIPSHSEVTVSVIVQPNFFTLSLLLFTEPYCCLLLLFNSNNKSSP